jgi:hypothetical protein
MRENSTEATYIRQASCQNGTTTMRRIEENVRAVLASLIAHTSAPAMSLGIYVAVTRVLPSPDPHSAALLSQSAAPDLIWSESMHKVPPK